VVAVNANENDDCVYDSPNNLLWWYFVFNLLPVREFFFFFFNSRDWRRFCKTKQAKPTGRRKKIRNWRWLKNAMARKACPYSVTGAKRPRRDCFYLLSWFICTR
jgi:hypothetical protein